MGAKYALYENPNPKGDGKKQPLHARIVPRGTIHTLEIAEEIADSCGYSTATTKGMLDALAKVISKNLRYGYTVELDDLGSFSISLKSRPVMDKKEIRSWSVNFGNVHFKGSKKLKNRLKVFCHDFYFLFIINVSNRNVNGSFCFLLSDLTLT